MRYAPRLIAAYASAALLLAAGPAYGATGNGLLQARQGVSALLRGQYEKAVASYTEALDDRNLSDPRRANIYNDRGVAKWRLGKAKEAVEDFNNAVALFPDYSVVYNNRGNALIDLGRPDEAIADFDRAIAIAPGYGAAYNNRGNAYHALGDYSAAARDFRKAAKLMPTNPVPFNGRGKTHVALGHPFAAVRDFNRAITLGAKYYSAHLNRAEALAALDAHDEAVQDFSELIEQRPEDAGLYLARGQAYARAKKYNSAFRDFDKALKLKPELAAAHVERGDLHMTLKRYKSAQTEYGSAIELKDDLAELHVKRAETHLHLGTVEEGLADVARALELGKPENEPDITALVMRARLYQALERNEEAMADYRAVLAADPANADARAVLETLGEALPPVPEVVAEPVGDPVKGWQIVRGDGRLVATNARYPKLRVPLEMYGAGEPKIIDWNLLKYQLQGIGLLEYFAGELKEDGGRRLEYVAIVDLWQNKVVAVEPDTWGESKATWDWQQVSVVVTDPEGSANEIRLRKAQADPYGNNQDSNWWSGGYWREAPQTRTRQQRRRAPQRGILDWLFN